MHIISYIAQNCVACYILDSHFCPIGTFEIFHITIINSNQFFLWSQRKHSIFFMDNDIWKMWRIMLDRGSMVERALTHALKSCGCLNFHFFQRCFNTEKSGWDVLYFFFHLANMVNNDHFVLPMTSFKGYLSDTSNKPFVVSYGTVMVTDFIDNSNTESFTMPYTILNIMGVSAYNITSTNFLLFVQWLPISITTVDSPSSMAWYPSCSTWSMEHT